MALQKIKAKQKDTARRILDTAAEVFAEAGFAGARMDDIANRTGVNKATIYYHIGDKKTLYTRVLHEHFANAGDRFDQVLQNAASPEDKLSLYIQQIAQMMDENPHKATMMVREIADRGEHFPDIVAQDLVVIIGKLMKILSEGEKQGRFIHVNPFSVHLMVIGAFVLYRVSEPLRQKIIRLADSAETPDAGDIGVFTGEIEHLILRALRVSAGEI